MAQGDGIDIQNLCRQIEEEKDPHRFSELVKRLNDLLDGESAKQSKPSEKK